MTVNKGALGGTIGRRGMKTRHQDTRQRVFEKLQESSLYQTYRRAFREATGLPLVMVFVESGDSNPCRGGANQNLFCQLLNCRGRTCEECVATNQALCDNANEKARSVSCFAGLTETAVPVRCGKMTIGILKTGQVFNKVPVAAQFKRTAAALKKLGYSDAQLAELKLAYFESPVIDDSRYRGMITILTAFAIQLGDLANRIMLEQVNHEPPAVTRAKKFIMNHLDEPLSLDTVANEVGVSSYYFCKLFKHATDLTFTEFVNRQRIEWAKRKLLEPDARVTEAAFDVGYQSLSQFNRSFSKIVGESPTQFRQRMLGKQDLLVA